MHTSVYLIGFLAVIAIAKAATLRESTKVTTTEKPYVVCENGYEYDPNNCGKYYKCNNGVKTGDPISCGAFYKFDEKAHACKFHWWLFGSVDCSRTKPVNPNQPTKSPSGTTTKSPDKTTTKKNSAPATTFSMSLGLFFLAALCFLS